MFKLQIVDIIKGLVVAILTGAFVSVVGLFTQTFDVFTADWVAIGKQAVNGGFYAFVGYIIKNFITADNGKIAGVL